MVRVGSGRMNEIDSAAVAQPTGPVPDAEALYTTLLDGVRGLFEPRTQLIGIVTGGAWLAERLQRDLSLLAAPGSITSALHRDDFAQRGMAGRGQTSLPFAIDGADLLLIDDVLHTGRTIRAVINELYDFGRPRRVRLAVLVDRNGRELPVQADFAATRIALAAGYSLAFERAADTGTFSFRLEPAHVPQS